LILFLIIVYFFHYTGVYPLREIQYIPSRFIFSQRGSIKVVLSFVAYFVTNPFHT